MLVALKTSPK